jgi:hypothetical protein
VCQCLIESIYQRAEVALNENICLCVYDESSCRAIRVFSVSILVLPFEPQVSCIIVSSLGCVSFWEKAGI